MAKQIHNFFQGSLYIQEAYLDALIPLYFKSITSSDDSDNGKTIEELEKSQISFINSSSSDINTTESAVKVVLINLIGPVIKYYDWWYDMLGTQEYMQILNRYKNDPSIAGVVFNMDTGGGQKYGTPEFFDFIADFIKVKPLVIYTNGLLCSGGYYIACPASYIIANKRADAIGSIGIYTEIFDINGYYESLGLKVHTIYSNLSSEKNKSYRDVIDGIDKNYENYKKKELDPDGQIFIDDMKKSRPQIKEEVFKGGAWNGEEAVKMGLVDANGSLQDAINKVLELAQSNPKSNSNNNKNSKKTSMSKKTKNFPLIQSLIGVEGEGVDTISTITGKKGVQLTEEQLEIVETALSGNEAALTAEKGKVTTAQEQVTSLETAVNTAIETAGLTASVAAAASIEDKITLLGSKVVEFGKQPGKKITNPKSEGDSFEEENSIVDANADHNKIYNQLP
ncbi:S49 family peptidase [Flavobacterium sediminilitoris]|uniref:S49 family peptidase n=1 Tax=Flavobacterium sediminilitoris TaxID=2024526 RepID=A0ABY4HT00_9FLAO|nr:MULTISPECIES: S49 family peptidase [Flavobacterium]UOX35302.1 S49 family peptidase [Flavobacterium sediminilitoris]